jgi:hypothetical protein
MTALCIYCLRDHEGPFDKAHIFPESVFGDHEYLFLREGEVCRSCNNRLSRLEKKFQANMGLIPLMIGPGVNKKGKPTTIDAPGLRATRDPRDPRIFLNLGATPVRVRDGQAVRPIKRPESIEVIDEGQSEAGYRIRIRHSFRLVIIARVLATIGFETLCLEVGSDYCRDPRWDRIRTFIMEGEGPRTCAVPKDWSKSAADGVHRLPAGIELVQVDDPERGVEAEHYWIAVVSMGAPFMIDLSPGNVVLARFFEKQPDANELALLVTLGGPGVRRSRRRAFTKDTRER